MQRRWYEHGTKIEMCHGHHRQRSLLLSIGVLDSKSYLSYFDKRFECNGKLSQNLVYSVREEGCVWVCSLEKPCWLSMVYQNQMDGSF